MKSVKQEVIDMLNQALRLEQSARIQYLAHAEQVTGPYAETIAARLREIAADEVKHEAKFRSLIASYLGGVPAMEITVATPASDLQSILTVNLKDEKGAIDFYKVIYRKVVDNKGEFPYGFERLEHDIRHIIMDEEEHAVELQTLLG